MIREENKTIHTPRLFLKHVALPAEHGAWVFLFSPLIIGTAIGGRVQWATLAVVAAALAGFLLRQPLTIAVKAYSGRRARTELPAARFWLLVYGAIAGAGALALLLSGYSYVLFLAAPAAPVLAWYLWLISRRAERRQVGVEIAASAILAFGAPAAYWVSIGDYDPLGWLLWGLCWLQAAASIIYVYLRLVQRRLPAVPAVPERLRLARPALLVNTLALLGVIVLSVAEITPAWLPLAYAIQWLEAVWGAFVPAVKAKPTTIGVRQLIVSILFTLAFILAW